MLKNASDYMVWMLGNRELEIRRKKVKGLAAKARLIQILNENNNEFILVSHGVGKFGRCLGELFITSDSDSINNQLVLEGHAKKYNGGKR